MHKPTILTVLMLTLMAATATAQFGPQGSEFQVNTTVTNHQRLATGDGGIACDANGNYVVVWTSTGQDSGATEGVYGQRYTSAGTPVGGEFLVNTTILNNQNNPAVAMDADGDFVVVWQSLSVATVYDIYARRYNSAGVPISGEFLVNTEVNNQQRFACVAMDDDGDFVVCWEATLHPTDGSGGGIYGQRYNNTGAAVGSEFRVNTFTTDDQFVPSVDMDANGQFVVVWHSRNQDGGGFGVYGQRFTSAGAAAGAEFRVNTTTLNGQIYPSVALDGDGDFVVAWTAELQDGDGVGVYLRRYSSAGTPLTGEVLVNTTTAGAQADAAVDIDVDGDFVVTWASIPQDGDSTGIYAQRYDNTGAPVGSEFQVNTFTTGAQESQSVAMDANGNFAVVWNSFAQDTDLYGVYGQRFGTSAPPVVTLAASNAAYTEDAAPALLDNAATVTSGQADFDTGYLLVEYTTGPLAEDELSVATTADVRRAGNNVEYDADGFGSGAAETVIGTVPVAGAGSGLAGAPLQVNFNAACTPAIAQAVLRAIAYRSTSQNPSAATRTAQFTVDDGAGGTSNQPTLDINVTPVNDAPVLTTVPGPGGPVGAEFRVNTVTVDIQAESAVAMDADGDCVVVWMSLGQDGSGYGIYAQRYNNSGAAVGSEFLVNTFTTNDQMYPSVAMDADGDFVIAWMSSLQDGASFGIYAQRYNNSGAAVGSEFLVNTFTTSEQQCPSVAMDADGDFVIAWMSNGQDGSGYGIYAQRYNNSGAAVGSEFLVNTFTTNSQLYPSVAMDADGDFVVVWHSFGQDGSDYGIYAQRYDNGGATVGSEFRVNTFTPSTQVFPSLAMDADGDFVIAWMSDGQDGSSFGIYAQRYNNSGAAVGTEFRVNTFTTNDQLHPSVAMDADGDFMVAWQSFGQDGNGNGIYAQRFHNSGAAVGSEFLVNSYTNNQQSYPSVAVDADGDFVVVWTSNGQDGSGEGIYAQRYGATSVLPVLNVDEGDIGTVIGAGLLEATDVDNTPGQLTFTLTTVPAFGTLRRSGLALGVGGTFTQADINAGLLTYDHDGSETLATGFAFSVADTGTPVGSTGGVFSITINPVNDAPTLAPGTISNSAYYFVSGFGNDTIGVYDSGWNFLHFLDNSIFAPTGLVEGEAGRLIAMSFGASSVRTYARTGTIEGTFGTSGSGTDVARDPVSGWIVSSSTSGPLDVRTTAGVLVRTLGAGPYNAVAVVPGGIVWAGGLGSNMIDRFDINTGSALPSFPVPAPLANGSTFYFDPSTNSVFVAQDTGNTIARMDLAGALISTLTTGGPPVFGARGIDRGNGGEVLVTSFQTGLIHRWDSSGVYLGTVNVGANSPQPHGVRWLNLGATEDTPFDISFANLQAATSAADVDGNVVGFRVTGVSTGTLLIDVGTLGSFVPVTLPQDVTSADTLRWTPAPDASGSALAAFNVECFDDGAPPPSLTSTGTVLVRIDVAGLNDAPTLTSVSTLLGGSEDTTYNITYAALATAANEADIDSATINFRVEAVSSGTLLIQPANVAVTPGVTLVTSADTLEWTPDLNANGAALNAFTIVAHDGSDVSAPAVQVTIEIGAVNDAPSLINGPYVFNNRDEDDTAQQGDEIDVSSDIVDVDGPGMGVAVMAADNTNGQWQYSINNGTNWAALSSLSDTNATLLASDPLQTRMRFVPNADWFGNASIQVRAWDRSSGTNGDTGVNVSVNGGTSAFGSNVVTATITIDPVNDAPTFTDAGDPVPVLEGTGARTVPAWATSISFGPANEAPQTLQFNVSVTGTTGTLAFSAGPAVDVGTGNLTYTATGNGTASVEITLQDNGGGADTSAAAIITITVLPVPTMVWVNAAWTGTPYGTDPDGAGPASYFGIDSFATAQAGIDAVATGGTVVISGAPLAGAITTRTMTINLTSGTLRGASPVITHNGPGTLTVVGGTLDQNTAFPTILVDGGIVQLDGVLVLESSVSNDFCVLAQATGTLDASTFGGNTFRVRGAGGGLIDNQTSTAINLVSGTANAYEEDATVFSVGTLADNFSIENRIVHAIDNIARGLVTWNTGNVYVTQASNSIQNGVDAASAGNNVHVQAGTYTAQVTANKSISLLGPNAGTHGTSGSRVAEARIDLAAGFLPLLTVSDVNVVVDGLEFYAFDFAVNRCITTSGTSFSGLTVRNNVFVRDATAPASGFGPVYAIQCVGNGSQSVTISRNLITGTVLPGPVVQAAFFRGVFLQSVGGSVGGAPGDGNTIGAYVQDVLSQFGPALTISNNTFQGSGVDISEPAPASLVQISGNSFTLADPALPQALLLKYSPNPGASIQVSGNSFNNYTVGVVVAAVQSVTFDGNDFNNAATATDYTHLLFSTSWPTAGAPLPVASCGMTLINNQFNHVAGPANGRALDFQNGNSASTIGTITIGTPGNENLFDGALPQYMRLQSATLQAPLFSPASNPAPAVFATNLNGENNEFAGTAPASMTAGERNALETKVYHKVDNVALGLVDFGFGSPTSLLVQSFAVTGGTPDAFDNDYTRINNAIQMTLVGVTLIELEGTFDWTETNANNSWQLGSDGITTAYPGDVNGDGRPDENDDYTILVPLGAENVTLTSVTGLGSARVQGPGDVPTLYWESFITFWTADVPAGADNRNWTISELELFDFDWTIGMFFGSNGSNAYDGTLIENNHIRMATDDRTDGFHNIGIHYAFGVNQTIRNNLIQIPGDGLSDTGASEISASVGMQCNTSGGAVFDGLLIEGNRIEVLNDAAADPERIRGFWENTGSNAADITVRNNEFVNLGAGNNPATNMQVAFRMTSRSSASTVVLYEGNSVVGANVAFDYYPGYNGAGTPPVQLVSNSGTDVFHGFNFSTATSVNLLDDNEMTGIGGGIGLHVALGTVVTTASVTGQNLFDTFQIGVHVHAAGSSAALTDVEIFGCGTGLLLEDNAVASLTAANIDGQSVGTDGVVVQTGGQLTAFANNFVDNHTGDGLRLDASAGSFPLVLTGHSFAGNNMGIRNLTGTPVDATSNWWGSPTGPTEASSLGGTGSAVTSLALVDYTPWYASGTDTLPGTPGFQGGGVVGSPSGEALHAIPTTLVWTVQPPNGAAAVPLSPAPTLRAQDGAGVLGFNFDGLNGDSLVGFVNNPSGATFIGAPVVQASGGVVVFSNLAISLGGVGYTVSVTGLYGSTNLFSPVSNPFNINNPPPVITSLTPTFVHAGSGAMLLQVDGANFSGTSTVRLNGVNRPTFYYSSTTLLAALSASDVSVATLHNVTVTNPAPGGGTTAALTFTVNGIPSVVNATSLDVDENLPAATTVGTLSTLDAGPIGDTHVFTLVFGAGGADNGSFAIVGSTLQTAASFNFELKSTYNIRVRCTDSFGAWVEQALVVSVNDVNESPTAANDGWGTNEDTTLNVAAPGVLGNDTDPDVPTVLTATLVGISVAVPGPEVSSFTFNANGSFTLVPALNYNGVVTFQYEAFDGVLPSAVATVTITISSVNDVPLAGNDTHGTNEDTILNVAAPGVLGNDSDAHGGAPSESNTPLTAVLVADVTNGTLTLNSDGSFSYTPDPDFNGPDGFTYRAVDSLSGQSTIASVTINVAAQNDAPTVTTNAGLTLAEGASSGVTQSLLEVSDIEDGAAALTYTLDIAPQFGQLLLGVTPLVATSIFTQQDIDLGNLSYQHDGTDTTADTFEFHVSDSGSALLPAVGSLVFNITITPVNDAPDLQAIAPFTGAIEDTAFVITLAQLQANATILDLDGPANHFRLGAILSGTLTMNGNPVTPGVTILGAGDQFEWTPPLNENTTFQTVPGAFSVAAWDGLAVSTAVLDVNIAIDFYVNDPGSITAGNVGVLEDAIPPTHSFPLWATFVTGGGADEPLNETVVSYQLSNLSNPGLFTLTGQPAVSAAGQLSFETAPNAFGVCTFDIQAVTNDGRDTPLVAYFSPPQQFTITVTNVNDAPTMNSISPLFGGTEGTTIVINWAMLAAAADEADIDSSPVNFRIEQVLSGTLALNSAAVVPGTSVFASGDLLEWTPPANDYGSLNAFTVVAHDGVLTSGTPVTVQLFVDAVNDQPSMTASNHTSDEDQGQVTVPGWATLQPGPNESHQTALQYTVSNVSNPALFSAAPTVDATGTLRYTAAADISGASTFDVTVQDNGGTASGGVDTSIAFNFTITVNPVNDAPTLTSVATLSGAAEDTPFNITFATIETAADEADIDSALIQFRVEGIVSGTLLIGATPVTPGTVITSADTLIWQAAQDANGVLAAFTITAWDGALASATPVTVNVDTAAINDAPTFSAGPDASVTWAAGAQTVFPWATGISAGPADEASQALTFNVTGNTNAALFSVQPAVAADGTLTFTPATNANGTATITLTLSDNGGTAGGGIDTSAPDSFDITVTAAPEIDLFRQVGVPIPDGTGVDAIGATLPIGSAQHLVYTIANTGNAALSLTGSPDLVAVSGASNCVAWITHLPASSVGAAGSTTFRLMLVPQAAGAFSVDLSIDNSDADESPYSFQVTGTAVDAPDIELARGFNDPLLSGDTDFTAVHPLTQNLVLDYTVRNVGTSDLVFGAPQASVTLELNCTVSVTVAPTVITAGNADTLTLTVTPGVTGPFEFVLRLDSNDPDEDPFFIHGQGSWSATPVPVIEVRRGHALAPSDTDVVGLLPSGSATTLLWEIRNLGAAPLAVTSPVTISGAVNCAAAVTLAPASVVAPGTSTLFGIDIQPTTPGPFVFALTFTNSDPNAPMFPLTVMGTATSAPTPEIAIERGGNWLTSGGTDDAGDFASGQFTPLFYRVVNEGTSTLNLLLSARVLSETNCEVRILSNPDAAIAPQDDSVMVIGVRPLATGALGAVIQLRSDDSDEGSFIINLIGTGPAPDIRVEYPRFVPLVSGGTLDTGSHSSLAVPITFVIRNVGTDQLNLTANVFSNEVNCTVLVTTPVATPLNVGGEGDLVIQVTVLAAGPFSFDMDIQSDDGDTPSFVILVSGVASSSGGGGGGGGGDDSNCSTGSGHSGWPALLAALGMLALAVRVRRSRHAS
ncbi:MAG: tandem-95 repeat protein [Planctomycetes bacterium]|nr:tandem-95 repeat protein [Planctomycetota bacterium]